MLHLHLHLLALLPLTTAHFLLNYPPARGFDEDTLPQLPCGGQAVTTNRTLWPTTGGPIQLFLEHTTTNIQVLIALGNDPGDAFNTVLVPTFEEDGPENFCMGDVVVPGTIGGVQVVDGMNATIQVVTNGDPDGGLYNCADITFTSMNFPAMQVASQCTNSTGVRTMPLKNGVFANQTTIADDTALGGSASASGTTPSATALSAGAAVAQATARVALVIGALGALGGMAVL